MLPCPPFARPSAGRRLPAGGRRVALCAAVLGQEAMAQGRPDVVALPSGVEARLHELIQDVKPDGVRTYARFRFVAPGIVGEGAPDFEARQADMDFLCSDVALPFLREAGASFDNISISLSDRETEFGQANPDAAQFFELYRVENGACIWEEF